MPFITFTVTGLNEVIGGLNRLVTELPNAKRNALTETADFMVNELRRNAHVISGRMRNSIRSQPLTNDSILVEVGADYAVYENRRGGFKVGSGPHNFADMAEQATRDRFGSIVSSAYGNMFSSL